MRGDTREPSAFHVSRLIADAGNHVARGRTRACVRASTSVMVQPPPTILYPIPFSTKFGTITVFILLDTTLPVMLSSRMKNDLRGRVKFPIGGIAHERVERHA